VTGTALPTVTYDAALAALTEGATVLTGSARLARRVLGDQAVARAGAGERVWERGDAIAWAPWLKRMHADALACGAIPPQSPSVLLTSAQADALWQRIIEHDPDRGLLQPTVAARHAAEAHALCAAWPIDRKLLRDGGYLDDVTAFAQWAAAFERELAANGWLVSAQLPEALVRWMTQVPDLCPRALYLVGFDVITPQQQRLWQALAALGVEVCMVEATRPPGTNGTVSVSRLACRDQDAERLAAARWARARLEADPTARLAVVVPDLAAQRNALARMLDAVLDPPALGSCMPRLRRPWNISLGWPLAEEPLIHDALTLLRAAGGRASLSFADASRLLRSPFMAGADSERCARLELERLLRDRREERAGLAQLARWAESDEVLTQPATILGARLAALLAAVTQAGGRLSAAAWAEQLAQQLTITGWPGERGLDSREHQALRAWQELLAEFASLAAVLPRLSRGDALRRLRRLAADRIFQPESPPAPVQILGLHDALGQQFDGLWLLGMDDETWPPAPSPNPFIPAQLQREAGVPQASAAGQLAHADAVTARLLASADEVIVSWARLVDDRNLRVSPLLADLSEAVPEQAPHEPWRLHMLKSAVFDDIVDVSGPALAGHGPVRGGATVFRDQSLCAFRAFAVHRLGADDMPTPAPGLNAMDRGIIVHRVLHALWKKLRTRAALDALDDESFAVLAETLVDEALQHAARDRSQVFTPRFTAVERRRLINLMMKWRECELARDDFRVAAVEEQVAITTTVRDRTLTVRARIDRLDELPDGRRILIDYKTGDAQPGGWLGLRPKEPQMPLYSGLFGDELAGMAYAVVRAGKCRWRGVTEDESVLAGVTAADAWRAAQQRSWQDLRTEWRAAVHALAGAFLSGDAAPDPLPGACKHCHLSALCRIDELRGSFARDPSADAQDDDDE
jgi:ATP-dependent helicase/nuclease subunit B